MHPKKMRRLQTGETAAGYLFVSPMLLGVGLFTFIPLLALFGLGFTDWNFVKGLSGLDFVGLKHFRNLLHDSVFQKSLMNNVTFMLVVPITMCLSLSLAILINKLVYLKDLFKLIYFMPFISSSVAVAIVFQVLFHPTKGPVNSMLKSLGVANPPMWLADIQFALPSIMMISIWVAIGFNMIIYMAGLQTIPHDLYEAADLDGATGWQKLVRITIPLLSPTSFFLLVTGIIGSFKVFDTIAVLTQGGPAHSTTIMVFEIYKTAFLNLKLGYASAMSLVLFLCVLLITGIQFYATI